MTARDDLFRDIWDMRSPAEKNALIDAYRDEVALDIGRDALRDGLLPTLIRLVGDANAARLVGDFRDAIAHEVADRARAGIAVFEEHVGGFQYSKDVCEIIDVIDPATPDPEGWDF